MDNNNAKAPAAVSDEKFSKKAKTNILFGVLLNMCSAIQYCWSLLGSQLIAQYGWTTVQASAPYSMLTFSSSLVSIFTGRWGDARAHREPIIFGGICLGVGLITSSMHANPVLMIFTAGMLLGFSSGPISGNVAAQANKWSPKSKRGLATALVTASLALGALYMTPLITTLDKNFGLVGTFRIMGIAAIIIVPALAMIQPQPDKSKFGKDQNAVEEFDDGSIYKNTKTPNMVLRTSHYWRFVIMYAGSAMCGQVLTSQVTIIAKTQTPMESVAFMVVILAVANAGSRLFWSTISDKIGPFNATRIMTAIQFVNLLLFRFYTTAPTFIIGCIVLSFCFSGIVPMLWNWITRVFGAKYVAGIQGEVTFWWGISGLIGPMIAAYMRDLTGTYTGSYIIFAMFVLAAFICACTEKDKKLFGRKEQPAA